MFFEFIRKLTIPFEEILKQVPEKGKVLDVGCGHGIFSRMIAENYPKTKVIGIDPSIKKIKIARFNSKGINNLTYKCSYLKGVNGKFDCMLITDMLYLLSTMEKSDILTDSFNLLKNDGRLIICELNKRNNLMFWVAYLEEIVMLKILRYTYSGKRGIFFLDTNSYIKIIKKSGFKTVIHIIVKGILPYERVLYTARK